MRRLFEALKNFADGAFVINEDLRIVYWNKAAEAILGFDREEVAGQFCYQLLNGFDESRRLICKERCRVMKLALQSRPVPNYDIRAATKQGENCWLNMSVFTYRMSDANGLDSSSKCNRLMFKEYLIRSSESKVFSWT